MSPQTLTEALDALSAAHGPVALSNALQRVAGAVKRQRRDADAHSGPLAQAYAAAMLIWDEQKAEGISRADRLAGLERTIRATWPFVREWKYLCDRCLDLGLETFSCPGDATCGRTKQHGPHTYGQPCWCGQGAKFREKPKPSAEDFTQAGLAKPAQRGFSRAGR